MFSKMEVLNKTKQTADLYSYASYFNTLPSSVVVIETVSGPLFDGLGHSRPVKTTTNKVKQHPDESSDM